MIQSFCNDATQDIFDATQDIFDGIKSAKARRLLPLTLWAVAFRKLDQLNHASDIGDLRIPPGNRLELLSGDRAGQYSIRINEQYRVCFDWTSEGPTNVEVTDYH